MINSLDSQLLITIKNHEPLIAKVCRDYGILKGHYMFDDCFSAGKLGIIKSLKNYDESKGKLSSYLYFYIRKEIQIELSQCPQVNLGCYASMRQRYDKVQLMSLNYKYKSHQGNGVSLEDIFSAENHNEIKAREKKEQMLELLEDALKNVKFSNWQKKLLNKVMNSNRKNKLSTFKENFDSTNQLHRTYKKILEFMREKNEDILRRM